MGSINWKWFIIGSIAGYAGSVYLPKLLSR